jgi:DNA-binding transcriptional LysR family regulator
VFPDRTVKRMIGAVRDLDVKTFRLFDAVCESRTMARAAEHELIEPSAISKRIAQLESGLVRQPKERGASLGICWACIDFEGLRRCRYGRDRLAIAVHPSHALAASTSPRFEQTLDAEHFGPAAFDRGARDAAARGGQRRTRGVVCVVVSKFEAALRGAPRTSA